MGRQPITPAADDDDGPIRTFINKSVKWIPGDILALYGAALAIQSQQQDPLEPDVAMVIVFLIATPIVVLLGGLGSDSSALRTGLTMVLSLVAFTIWSASLANNGWRAFEWFPSGWQTIVYLGLAGLLFGLLADWIETKLD